MARLAPVVVAAALLVGACSGDDAGNGSTGPDATTGSTTTVPSGTALDGVALSVEEVATLAAPTAMATRAGTNDLYVTEKAGRVRRIAVDDSRPDARTYRVVDRPVLDLSSTVADSGEQGLLGLAFSSDGRRLFVFATLVPDGTTSLAAYDIRDDGMAEVASRRSLFTLPRKFSNHNGGQLALGPDGYLYIAIGDGGGGGDPDHHGQDRSTLFAKILRIDPDSGGDRPYAIPAGNPFADGGGRPEVWLYGVRNPWRFSFDRANGDLWVADVGQEEWEEVDRLPATAGRDAGRGANLGWSRMEGGHGYDGTNPDGGVLPIYEYSHEDGCSITGGYVYRGAAIPKLEGAYLFADYCRAGLRAIVAKGDEVVASRSFDVPVTGVQSFGEDTDGEVYVLLAAGPVLRLISAG